MTLTNEDWKYKIVNASPTRLVIVTYELIIERIERAKNFLKEGDEASFRANVTNAKEFVTELACVLDFENKVASDMANLYMFVNKLLTKGYFSKDLASINNAEGIIKKLMNGLMNEVDDELPKDAKPAEVSDTYGKPVTLSK